MQNYDGQFKLNGQEYFYRAKDDSGSSKITMESGRFGAICAGVKRFMV